MDKKQELNPLLSGLFITNGLRNNLPISLLFVVVLAAIVAEYVRVLFLQFNATPCFFFFFPLVKIDSLCPHLFINICMSNYFGVGELL
jgi:hypothetical protein